MPRTRALTCLIALTFTAPFVTTSAGCSDDGDEIVGDGDTSGPGDGDPGDGDPTGDGDGDPEPVDMSTYSAVIQPGGVDRIVITRVNTDEQYNSCTVMVLWSPMQSDGFDITIPDTWRIEQVTAWKQGFCPMDMSSPDLMPDGGTGTITFAGYDALGTYPCALNFDLELDMNSDPPTTRTWRAQGIPVEGVNCG